MVGNIRRAGLDDEPRADMYFPFEQPLGGQITLFIRTGGRSVGRARRDAGGAPRRSSPTPCWPRTQTLAEVASESVRITRLVLWLLATFAVTALALAAVGIYGVMSYACGSAHARSAPGSRWAPSGGTSSGWCCGRGRPSPAIGTAAGLAIGLVAARSLRSILYGVSTADPLILLGAAALLAGTAMVACFLPARRAVAVDPARTLTEE